jgi:hypothetical protein
VKTFSTDKMNFFKQTDVTFPGAPKAIPADIVQLINKFARFEGDHFYVLQYDFNVVFVPATHLRKYMTYLVCQATTGEIMPGVKSFTHTDEYVEDKFDSPLSEEEFGDLMHDINQPQLNNRPSGELAPRFSCDRKRYPFSEWDSVWEAMEMADLVNCTRSYVETGWCEYLSQQASASWIFPFIDMTRSPVIVNFDQKLRRSHCIKWHYLAVTLSAKSEDDQKELHDYLTMDKENLKPRVYVKLDTSVKNVDKLIKRIHSGKTKFIVYVRDNKAVKCTGKVDSQDAIVEVHRLFFSINDAKNSKREAREAVNRKTSHYIGYTGFLTNKDLIQVE